MALNNFSEPLKYLKDTSEDKPGTVEHKFAIQGVSVKKMRNSNV